MRMRKIFQVLFTITLVLFLLGLIFMYIGWNAMKWLQSLGVDVSLVVCVFVTGIIILSYVFSRIRYIPMTIRKLLTWVGSFSFFWLEWLLILLPIANIVVWGTGAIAGQDRMALIVPWVGWVVVGIISIGTIVGAYFARKPVVRNYALSLAKPLPNGQASLRIFVASDLHTGHLVGRKHVQRLVDLAHSLQPDLILFAGDVLDDDVRPFLEQQMDQQLAQMKAPLGTYAILGNHEYYGGGIQQYVTAMQAIGIPVLQDEVVYIERFGTIVGRKDHTANQFATRTGDGGRKSIDQLLVDVDMLKLVVVLDHQPKEIRKAAQAGVDIVIGGHTHLGQFWPNHWFTRRLFDLDYGYRMFGHTHAVVSSGWGTWGPPVRIGSQCEAVLLEITGA
jgi:predicted MPP superfamily phosphohydrolase